jgi:hypothetical protein
VPAVVEVAAAVVVGVVVAVKAAPSATDKVMTEPFAARLPACGNAPTT